MADSFKVAAGAVVVKLNGGGEQMLLRGALISGSGYKVDDVKRLAGIGLIEAAKPVEQSVPAGVDADEPDAAEPKDKEQAKPATRSTTKK